MPRLARRFLVSILAAAFALAHPSAAQNQPPAPSPRYQFHPIHNPDGTGKFYMGREIAQVMGPGGIGWLDRPQREQQEHSAQLLDALSLHPGEVVADLGAGSGFFTFRIAPLVGPTGKVLAVDFQPQMLSALRAGAASTKTTNVQVVQATETDPHLPAASVDLVLLVDVYHELAFPFEVMTRVREALKPGGRVVFVEYRKEDPAVPIKELHKMSVPQLRLEIAAAGLTFGRTIETLPLQHIVIFRKPQ